MKSLKIEAVILAIGLALAGFFIRSGINSFAERNRIVTVKGLAEMEVPADLVTWPLTYTLVGNDLPSLYEQAKATNQKIVDYLTAKGISKEEITASAPTATDNETNDYYGSKKPYRYSLSSTLTVTSHHVDLVRQLTSSMGELFKMGIAISGYASYDYTALNKVKPGMIEKATKNAREVADKFAKDSNSKLGKIMSASQGQFSIGDRDPNTPYIKEIRVVTTINYSLND